MNFVIRQARASDAEAASRLVTGLAHYFLSDPNSAGVRPFMARLTPSSYAERLSSTQFNHYIAEDSVGLCGVIALRDESHLYHLFVRADAQGQGVSRALWHYAKAQSKHSTFTVNSSLFAVPVYEHLGFVAKTSPQKSNGLVFVPMVYSRD
ncbi:GNAT family N-acetyltransferase [Comamonas sp. 26]|uniref:GNAT family N-acetyltransferase n=1 Tax=Comamonas sp. 26 TaxID=2035201 RepID=UPI000C1A4CC1|nr:GNAT family N-acetyltransferase [Comamonas sp. 26]